MPPTHPSIEDTVKHSLRVYNLLRDLADKIVSRGANHDFSKTVEPEVSIFDEFTPKLTGSTFGSDEYKSFLAAMKPALDHHYFVNRHHPEHFTMWKCQVCATVFQDRDAKVSPCYGPPEVRLCPKCCPVGTIMECQLEPHIGVEGMTLIDLLEMICDWIAASERRKTGDAMKSIEINAKRFNIGDQLKAILQNTVRQIKEDEQHAQPAREVRDRS